MATNIVLKRSSTSGAIPGTSDLALGEIAINTYDGKMFTKKTVSGSSSIVELTGNVALSSSPFDLINYKFVATSNQTSFSGNDANSISLAYASGTIQVFLNGILLDPTDYTATNGTAVVLDTGANSGDILYISRFAGVNPFDDFKYVADANQTTFTGSDANSETLVYTVGNLAVYLNGVLLDATDFTATNGSSVVLASAASAGDILHIHEFNQTGLTEIHSDTSPTLGGDLDMHTFDLVTTDNRNIDIIPHGTGNVNLTTDTVLIGTSGENVVVTSNGTGDMTVSTNSGTNSGVLKILDGANQNIEITPNGSGKINLDGLLWPNADGSANQYLQTDGSGNLSFVDVLDTSEEIQDTVGAMFTSNTETGITATYQDSDGTIDLVVGTLNQNTTGSAATLTTSRTIHGVGFDGSANIDLTEVVQDTVGAMFSSNTETNITVTYEDSDGTIDLVVDAAQPNVTSLGTLTSLTVDDISIDGSTISDAGVFGIDAGSHIILDAGGGNIYLTDDATDVGVLQLSNSSLVIRSLVSDEDILFKGNDGGSTITALTLDMSNAGAATFNHDITTNKTLNVGGGTAAGDNASVGYASAEGLILTGQGSSTDVVIKNDANQSVLNIPTGTRNVVITAGSLSAASLDISGDVDVDGTLEADAITVNGTTLAETISDTVGAMVGSNTESGITVAYQDSDNTLDFTVGTLNQNTTGTAATVTTAAQPNITSLGTLTTLTVDNIIINGTNIGHTSDTDSIAIASNGVVTFSQIPVLPANSIDSDYYVDASIDRAHIADDAVNSEHIADDVVNSQHYVDGSIDTAHIGDDQVTGAKIENAVTFATSATAPLITASGSANVTRNGPIGQGSGAVQTWDVTNAANTFFVPSDNNTVMNPGGTAVAGAIIQVEIAMGSSVYAIAWQNKFKFGGDGSTPTVTATANKTDIFTFRYNGTVWQEIGRVQNVAQTV